MMKKNDGITLRQIVERASARRTRTGVFYAHQSGHGDYNSHIEISFPKGKPVMVEYSPWSKALPHVHDAYVGIPTSLWDVAHTVSSAPENPAAQFNAIMDITGDWKLASALPHLWEDWVLAALGFEAVA